MTSATEWLAEQVAAALAEATPPVFRRPVPAHPQVTAWVDAYLTDPATSPSLLLSGATGVGKTHQAWQALTAAVVGAYRSGARTSWKAISHPDFNAATRPGHNGAHITALHAHSATGLLLFDDLGAAQATDWAVESLYRLVDHRWQHQLPVIWTTNATAGQLTASLGDRLMSRIWDCRRVTVAGPDHRRSPR